MFGTALKAGTSSRSFHESFHKSFHEFQALSRFFQDMFIFSNWYLLTLIFSVHHFKRQQPQTYDKLHPFEKVAAHHNWLVKNCAKLVIWKGLEPKPCFFRILKYF